MKEQTEFPSTTHEIMTGCGKMYIHLLYKDKERTILHGLKSNFGKSGGCAGTHFHSKVALLNSLIKHAPHSVTIRALTDASGHHCFTGDTCHDLLIRLVIDELMKIKL